MRETGIWLLSDKKIQSWLGSSPDGMIELNGKRRRILEMKRPFMRGKPIPYKNVCTNHIADELELYFIARIVRLDSQRLQHSKGSNISMD